MLISDHVSCTLFVISVHEYEFVRHQQPLGQHSPIVARWVLAEEIIENLEAGLNSFREVLAGLAKAS